MLTGNLGSGGQDWWASTLEKYTGVTLDLGTTPGTPTPGTPTPGTTTNLPVPTTPDAPTGMDWKIMAGIGVAAALGLYLLYKFLNKPKS